MAEKIIITSFMTEKSSNKSKTGTEVYPLDVPPSLYERIQRDRLFHFQEEFFEVPLPSILNQNAVFTLIRDKKADQTDIDPLDHPADWHILNIRIGEKDYPTFLGLRRSGKLPGTLKQALVDFAVRRAAGNHPAPSFMTAGLRKLMFNLTGIEPSESTDESELERIVHNFLEKSIGESPQAILETFMKTQGIPVSQQDNTYFFSAREGEFTWNARFEVHIKQDILTLISTANLELENKHIDEYLRDINALNEGQLNGFFRVVVSELPTIEFVSTLPLSVVQFFPEHLSSLLTRNMDSMHAMCTAFKSHYAKQSP
ncbi:MAG: hypothetical protein ACO3FI_08565 [Cyclobacteriaceae bacterium]